MSALTSIIAQVEFPPIENIVEYPGFFNKIAVINLIAVVATSALFFAAASKKAMVPKGAQNLAESAVDFIRKGIIDQTIGSDGMRYLPYLAALFFYILIGNFFGIIPTSHMPANARMANPAFLALLTWAFFICVGVRYHGLKYFTGVLFPPGVPKALYLLVTPIELISTFIVRPFSLAVRLFANMLAGHILLVTFSVLTMTLFSASALVLALPFSFGMLVGLTGFEVMVCFLQAYIFTILAAVYIGGALHPEH